MTLDKTADTSFSIPLDINDIISICRQYAMLGWEMQGQIESLLEIGVAASIQNGSIKSNSLPFIKDFLQHITKNAYFGEATLQAEECLYLLDTLNNQQEQSPLN